MKSSRRSILEGLIAGGAVLTLAGTLVSGGFGYFGGENDRAAARYNEACKHAYDMLTDDKLNPYLTEQEARELALTQLLVAKKCTKDARL